MAPYITSKTVVGAIPGPGGFNWLARNVFGDRITPTLFAASALPWACRIKEYGKQLDMLGIKPTTSMSVEPASETEDVLSLLTTVFHNDKLPINTVFENCGHFLATTLWPTNAIMHPGVAYGLLVSWDGKAFEKPPLFYQGVDQVGADALTGMSDEMGAIVAALKAKFGTKINLDLWKGIYDYQLQVYGHDIADKTNIKTALNTNRAFRGLTLPCKPAEGGGVMPNFHMRYYTEDLPHGLAVIRGIGEVVGVSTPTVDKVLLWAQQHSDQEYLVDGHIKGKDVAHSGCPQRFGRTNPESLI